MVKMDGSIREQKLAFNPTKDGLFEVLPPPPPSYLLNYTISLQFAKGCLPQILLGPFLNTLTQMTYYLK